MLKWEASYGGGVTYNNANYAYSWQLNGAFKPDSSQSRTTPGFSEIAAFYSLYRVNRFRCRLQFSDQVSTAGQVFYAMAFISDAAIGTAGGAPNVDLSQNVQLPANRGKTKQLAAGNSGQAVATITFPWRTVQSVWGQNPKLDPVYASATNTVPSRGVFLNAGLQWNSGAAATNCHYLKIELFFDVTFYEYIDSLTSFDTETGKPMFYSSRHRYCGGCYALKETVFDELPLCSCGGFSICTNCDTKIPCCPVLRSPNCTLHDFKLVLQPIQRTDSRGTVRAKQSSN